MLRAEHPSKSKVGDVSIFYRSTSPVIVLNVSSLNECTAFELSIANKIFHSNHLYRTASQRQDKLQGLNQI